MIDMDVIGNYLLHIVAALGCGMAIGLERQLGQHPAGIRTNALVCLGSALFVNLTSLVGDRDLTRVAAQIVSGVGFICGGAILREGISVRGMNTAATLWCSAAIGTLVGADLTLLAVIGTVAIIGAHLLFKPIANWVDNYTHSNVETELLYEVKIVCQRVQEAKVRALLLELIKTARLRLQGLSLQDGTATDHVEMRVNLFALMHDEQAMNDLVANLASQETVKRVSWDKAH